MAGVGSLNLVILVGRVGKKFELKTAANNRAMIRFSIGVDEIFRNSAKKYTTWVLVTAWAQTAKFIEEHVPTGTLIIVQGRLHVWKKDDTHVYWSVQANEVTLLSRPKGKSEDVEDEAADAAREPGADEEGDEETPF